MKYTRISEEEKEQIVEKIISKTSYNCDRCGSKMRFHSKSKKRVTCTWSSCKNTISVYKDTIFYRSKIDKTTIIRILELWMCNASYKHITYETGVTNKVLWKLFKRVYSILVKNYYSRTTKIGGNNKIVEIDESKFGKRKYNRGHRVEGVWVFGMVEKSEERRIHLVAVDDRKSETLTREMQNIIKSDSIIHSDCWKGYKNVIKKFYKHLTVNHSVEYKNKITGCHTNTIEGNWSAVKLNIPYRGRTKDKINLYLVRFMILRNEKIHPLHALLKYLS